MAKMVNFKKISSHVLIENHDYVLISFDLEEMTEEEKKFPWLAPHMYGTLDREYLDANGRTNRVIILGDLASGKTVAEAIQHRNDYFEVKRITESLSAKLAEMGV